MYSMQVCKNELCRLCIWIYFEDNRVGCTSGENRSTYLKIDNSQTPSELLSAFKARAEHMRNLLKQKGIEI